MGHKGAQGTETFSNPSPDEPADALHGWSSPEPCRLSCPQFSCGSFTAPGLELTTPSSSRSTWSPRSRATSAYSCLGGMSAASEDYSYVRSSRLALPQESCSMISGGPLSITSMADQEVLRATYASSALAGFGAALRGGTPLMVAHAERALASDMWYNMSFPTAVIDDFWSHSWRASSCYKIITLLLYYNTLPAAILGSIAAVMLRCWQIYLQAAQEDLGPLAKEYVQVPWIIGQVVFLFTLLLWRPSSKVFLDKACIHQSDPRRKEMGVKGIGVFLRNSHRMVVLWDDTYFRRLWCTFEVAAYLYHHQTRVGKASLHVRPVGWGPICLIIMICTSSRSLWRRLGDAEAVSNSLVDISLLFFFGFTAHLLRRHVRSIGEVEAQLQSFKFDTAECFCCSHNHIDPQSGNHMGCDRQLVKKCICKWFGSVENFETKVQQDLVPVIRNQFSGWPFPLRWCLVCNLQIFWGTLGFGLSRDLNLERALAGCIVVAKQFLLIQVMAWLASKIEAVKRSPAGNGRKSRISRLLDYRSCNVLATMLIVVVPCVVLVFASATGWVGECYLRDWQISGQLRLLRLSECIHNVLLGITV